MRKLIMLWALAGLVGSTTLATWAYGAQEQKQEQKTEKKKKGSKKKKNEKKEEEKKPQ